MNDSIKAVHKCFHGVLWFAAILMFVPLVRGQDPGVSAAASKSGLEKTGSPSAKEAGDAAARVAEKVKRGESPDAGDYEQLQRYRDALESRIRKSGVTNWFEGRAGSTASGSTPRGRKTGSTSSSSGSASGDEKAPAAADRCGVVNVALEIRVDAKEEQKFSGGGRSHEMSAQFSYIFQYAEMRVLHMRGEKTWLSDPVLTRKPLETVTGSALWKQHTPDEEDSESVTFSPLPRPIELQQVPLAWCIFSTTPSRYALFLPTPYPRWIAVGDRREVYHRGGSKDYRIAKEDESAYGSLIGAYVRGWLTKWDVIPTLGVGSFDPPVAQDTYSAAKHLTKSFRASDTCTGTAVIDLKIDFKPDVAIPPSVGDPTAEDGW
jgi:hypothetical protein